MRTKGRLSLCALLTSVVCGLAAVSSASVWADAQAYTIIVHPTNTAATTTREFVAQAFLKRVTRWEDGETIRPVDLPSEARTRSAFSLHVLNRSVDAMRSYWQQRIFSGRDLPPPELESDDAVLRYVASTPGAIGYVSANAKLQNVKALVLH
jgi:ABC-type phosphate transport system substrate-binding protein